MLKTRSYRRAIDAIATEDLFTDGEQRQEPSDIRHRDMPLRLMLGEQKPVLCVGYSEKPRLREYATRQAASRGYHLLMTNRELTTLGESK